MDFNLNTEVLRKKSNEELEEMFNETSKPTLQMVLTRLRRKPTKKKKVKKSE